MPRPLCPACMMTGWALRRPRHGEGTARLEPCPDVLERLHLGRVGEEAGAAVGHDRVVGPGRPMAHDDLDELVGAVVAQIVLQMLVLAEVRGLRIVERSDDVPGGPAFDHEVERREGARHVERLVVGRGVGPAQTEVAGHHAHRGQDRDEVHLHRPHAVADGGRVVAAEVRHGQPVVEERHMELALFQRAGDALVVLGGEEVRHRGRMTPRAREVAAVLGLEEGDHRDASAMQVRAHDTSPSNDWHEISGPRSLPAIRFWL